MNCLSLERHCNVQGVRKQRFCRVRRTRSQPRPHFYPHLRSVEDSRVVCPVTEAWRYLQVRGLLAVSPDEAYVIPRYIVNCCWWAEMLLPGRMRSEVGYKHSIMGELGTTVVYNRVLYWVGHMGERGGFSFFFIARHLHELINHWSPTDEPAGSLFFCVPFITTFISLAEHTNSTVHHDMPRGTKSLLIHRLLSLSALFPALFHQLFMWCGRGQHLHYCIFRTSVFCHKFNPAQLLCQHNCIFLPCT